MGHLGEIITFAKNYQDKEKNRPFQASFIEGYLYSLLDASLFAERTIKAFGALEINNNTPIPFGIFNEIIAQTVTLSGTLAEITAQIEAIKNWSGELVALSGSRLQAVDTAQIVADIADMTARMVAASEQILVGLGSLSGIVKASNTAGNNQSMAIAQDETTLVVKALAQVEAATIQATSLLDQLQVTATTSQILKGQIEAQLLEAKNITASEIDSLTKVVLSVSDSATKATSDAAVTASKREEADRLTAQAQIAYKELSGFQATLQETQKMLSDTYNRANQLTTDFEDQRDQISEMIAQAEKMVSGSTVSGLALAFDQERKNLDRNMSNSFTWFLVGIFLLFITSGLLAAYVLNINIPGFEYLTKHTSTDLTIAQVLSRAIIVVAPLWLTLFSARRYRSLFDLRQQYSHKYNMAFSMEGFKTQAPAFAENIAAWVFTIVAANPVLPKAGTAMDTPPPLTIEGMMSEVKEIYGKVMGKPPT